MSLNSFIPQLWSDTILAALRINLVFGNLFNSDYEGQLKQMGDVRGKVFGSSGDQKHAQMGLQEVFEDLVEMLASRRVETDVRFIQDEQAQGLSQGASDLNALSFAVGEGQQATR